MIVTRFIRYAVAFLPVTAIAATVPAPHRCSTPDLAENIVAEHNAAYEAFTNGSRVNSFATTDVVISTYVHVVTTDDKIYNYSFDMINRQMALLNNVFQFMGISFNLETIDFTANNGWARSSPGSYEERVMRTFLQKQIGSYNSLNLYFLSDLGADGSESLLGFCRFPVSKPGYDDYLLDGCINGADTLPGGASQAYGLGYTAAHEVGHWFDLYHPFQGGSCSIDGDQVTDTPNQSTPSSGCPIGKDSCPSYPGTDSIHNIMDYSNDNCLINFSIGQANRARSAYDLYRAPR